MWQHFFVAKEVMTKERREGRRSMSGGKGRMTPRNISSFVRTELEFLAKSESEVFAKVEFCMLVFW